MKRFHYLIISAAMLMMAATAFAGEGHAEGMACTNDAQACVNMMATKAASHGWMGVDGEVDKESGYFVINVVAEDSPAAKAGFKAGHKITAINGETVNFNDEKAAQAVMAAMVPNAEITFTVAASYGKTKEIAVTLQEMPESEVAKMLGKHMLRHVEVAENSSR